MTQSAHSSRFSGRAHSASPIRHLVAGSRARNDGISLTPFTVPRPRFGDEPPLVADRRRQPDKRQVSARWLAGTLLTGITSSALMSIALAAALDGHRDLSTPRRVAVVPEHAGLSSSKAERVVATVIPAARNRQTIELSTMTREGDREVIRTLPFGYVSLALAGRNANNVAYPPFNALQILTDGGATPPLAETTAADAQIYGAKVESEMSLKVEPFTFENIDATSEITTNEAETLVRAASPTLSYAPVQVASLEAFDASRFLPGGDVSVYEPGAAFRVVAQNVSVSPRDLPAATNTRYAEEIVPFRKTAQLSNVLADTGYEGPEVEEAVAQLVEELGTDRLEVGDVLRVGSEMADGTKRIVRLSAYRGTEHRATIARDDNGLFDRGAEPPATAAVAEAFDETATEPPLRSEMPRVYDAVYQAALAYGLNDRMCRQLLSMLSSDVDFQARVGPADRLVVFYTMNEGEETANETSQILYAETTFGGESKRYYRFRAAEDERYDYYDKDGRSAKQFLLRTPVPNGKFTSPFGGRIHPILGYARAHWGVDWSAPRGTPILASGDGVVQAAGWESGYGRQTIIRHANGYETSYSHQSSIARGVSPGAKVRQGQVIGAVGSTGLSTGNHLHYEVIVNGQKVDPMRIKFPAGNVLKGEELETFREERDRIDELLRDRAEAQRVAGR